MSRFSKVDAPCNVCGARMTFDVAQSVNAARRPDLRAEILAGTFQIGTCTGCGTSFRNEPSLTYIDVSRGQWLLAGPVDDKSNWRAIERVAKQVFNGAFGPTTPVEAQELGAGLTPRIVFGWPALREKLVCAEHELEDAGVELFKLNLLRLFDEVGLDDETEIRLAAVTAEALTFVLINPGSETIIETYRVPRQLFTEFEEQSVSDPLWAALGRRLTGGLFIDMDRVLLDR